MMHRPVLLHQALELLAIRPDGIYVDATFGAGGHSRAILERLTSGRLIAFDRDPAAGERARAITDPRFSFVDTDFRYLADRLDALGVERVDGVLFDLGVSSMHLDDPNRGFSFKSDALLDMRMDPRSGPSAYEVLATASESELARIFYEYGEERAARRLARAVVERRRAGRLPRTTGEFARLVAGVVRTSGRTRIHPATRAFQALRIAVNDELGALRDGLSAAIDRLRGAGRVAVISFHSLEDRIVKQAFRDDPRLDVLTRKPIVPEESETADNPRARSAKLRAAERKAG
jgi:16S rRNA (cytosine1402-N4)-methyltransferase